MSNYEIIAAGLEFPEGPVVMPDGSIVLVEIKRGTITRVDPDDGSVDVVAQPGGGPNGAAIGPDGAPVSNTHLRAHETGRNGVIRLML